MTKPTDIVHAFHDAIGKKDYVAARRCLSDRLHFKGPIDEFNDADAYVEALKKLGGIVERVDPKKLFIDGQDVCVLYDMVTRTPAGTAFIAEWLTVEGDKIARIRTVFDARPFAAMFSKR
jgi:hypothetical protein